MQLLGRDVRAVRRHHRPKLRQVEEIDVRATAIIELMQGDSGPAIAIQSVAAEVGRISCELFLTT